MEKWHTEDDRVAERKKENRLKMDETNSSILYGEEDGRNSALDFSVAGPLLPGGAACISMEGRSEHPWDGDLPKLQQPTN